MSPRRFRGTIACEVPHRRTFHGDPQTREQVLELPRDSALKIVDRINQKRLPLRMEHEKSHHIGHVIAAHLDEKQNLVCDFEIEDELAQQLIDLDHPVLGWRGLSLSHNVDTGEPMEVSLCAGKSGARPGTCITTELQTNNENHKAAPEYGTIIQASELSFQFIPPVVSDMSSMTFVRDTPPAATYSQSPAANQLLHSDFQPAAAQKQQQAPPPQQQQQQEQPEFDWNNASEAELVALFKSIPSSNLAEEQKIRMIKALGTLYSRAVNGRELQQQQRLLEEKNANLAKDAQMHKERVKQQVKTLQIALSKWGKLMGRDPMTADDEKELETLAANGGLDALGASRFVPKLIEASEASIQLALDTRQQLQQQQQQQQQQQPHPVHSSISKSLAAFEELLNRNRSQLAQEQTRGGYSLPTSTTAVPQEDNSTRLVEASGLTTSRKRTSDQISTDSHGWDFNPTMASIFKEIDSTPNGRMKFTHLVDPGQSSASSSSSSSHESESSLAPGRMLGQFGFKGF